MKWEKALETIIVLALALLVASVWFAIERLIYASIVLLVLPFISKKLTTIIGKAWFTFSDFLGKIMSYIIMFLIFYLCLVPISFLQRLFGKNQILKKAENNTHFIKRNHLFTKKDIKNPW